MSDTSIPSLRGKRALVTGAGSGIGAATARLLGRNGAQVGLHYRNDPARAVALRDEIRASGGRADILDADLADMDQVERLAGAFLSLAGGIDILVNNAGGAEEYVDFREMSQEAWTRTMAVNAQAPLWLCRSVWDAMIAGGGGRIVNISSAAVGYGGSAKGLHYVAAKSALEAMTRALAKEGVRHNILVNAVRPGLTATGNHRKLAGYTDEDYARRAAQVPLGRAGRPEEVAAMVGHLVSADGGFITGQVITVAGGD